MKVETFINSAIAAETEKQRRKSKNSSQNILRNAAQTVPKVNVDTFTPPSYESLNLGAHNSAMPYVENTSQGEVNMNLMLAETSNDSTVINLLNGLVGALSNLYKSVECLQVALAADFKAEEQKQNTEMQATYKARKTAETEHDSFLGIINAIVSFGEIVVTQLLPDLAESVGTGGVDIAADVGDIASGVEEINTLVEFCCACVVTAHGGHLNELSSDVVAMANGGLLALVHNKTAEEVISTVLTVGACAGGLGAVRTLFKAGSSKLAVGLAAETILTTVGGLGSTYANPNSTAGKYFGRMAGGILSLALVESVNGLIKLCDPSMNANTEELIDGVITLVAGIVDVGIMYKNIRIKTSDGSTLLDKVSDTFEVKELERKCAPVINTSGEDVLEPGTNTPMTKNVYKKEISILGHEIEFTEIENPVLDKEGNRVYKDNKQEFMTVYQRELKVLSAAISRLVGKKKSIGVNFSYQKILRFLSTEQFGVAVDNAYVGGVTIANAKATANKKEELIKDTYEITVKKIEISQMETSIDNLNAALKPISSGISELEKRISQLVVAIKNDMQNLANAGI